MLKCGTPGTYTTDKPLANYDGVCYACNYTGAIGLSLGGYNGTAECDSKCGALRRLDGTNCVLK